MRRFVTYLRKLTEANAEQSSKRFIAIYLALGIVTYLVIRYTDSSNYPLVLGEILGFIAILLGIGAAQMGRFRDNTEQDEETNN